MICSRISRSTRKSGGNGFMAVAASHAALLLAQGVGRLLRRADDRGVIAVLDSRLATARAAAADGERRQKGNDGFYCGAALELPTGEIVTGTNSPLFHSASAA